MRIRFLQTENGKEPARDYVLALDSKQRQKVAQTLESIQNLEGRAPAQYLKKLTRHIWEVRVIFAGNIFRLQDHPQRPATTKIQTNPSSGMDL